MRTVVYFRTGMVADFAISDERFEEFTASLKWDLRQDEDQLLRAQHFLHGFMIDESRLEMGPEEEAAACFVWNFFNTHPDDDKHIEGDILIIDLNGDGETVEYASVDDVELAPEN